MIKISHLPKEDFHRIWHVFQAVLANGRTYALPDTMDLDEAATLWCTGERTAYIAEDEAGQVIGTFYLRANMPGPGSHIANGGIMIAHEMRGKGYGMALAQEMIAKAKASGYRAIQFNNVVETNTASLAIWKQLGFSEIGCVPEAFQHKDKGLVDSFILYKKLVD